MDKEVKKLLVDALRSGEYKQTRSLLREGDSFCFQGVLCDLHAKASGGEWEPDTLINDVHLYRGRRLSAPPEVWEWTGLHNGGSLFVAINGERKTLAHHNDDGRTFAEIADAIEEQL